MVRRGLFRRERVVPALVIALAAVFAAIPARQAHDAVRAQMAPLPATLSGSDLVEALRQGGYVIIFRHAATDNTFADEPPESLNLKHCDTQRPLSDFGRGQALAIGQAFRQLAIPISRVYASPYCRALETARLAFTVAEPVEPLRLYGDGQGSDGPTRIATLQQLAATVPVTGTNAVVVTHVTNIGAAFGGVATAEADAVVFQPDGAGDYTLVAKVTAVQWADLAGIAPAGS